VSTRYLLLLAALLSLGACLRFSDDVSFAPCDGAVEIEPACAACMQAQCEAPLAACRSDEACCEDYTCLAACPSGDAICRAGCLDPPGRRSDLVAAMDDCRRQACAEACLGGGDMDYGWPEVCGACLNDRCWQETAACTRSAVCETEIVCDADCWDPGCIEACWILADPVGEVTNACITGESAAAYGDESTDYWGCLYRHCRAECGMGTTWGCVGDYRWPAPIGVEGGVLMFSMAIVDAVSGLPVEGVTMSACRRADVDCDPPIAAGVSAADGYACVDLPVGSEVGFTGYFRMTHPDYMVTDDQYGRPLYISEAGVMSIISDQANEVFWASMDIELEPDRGIVSVGVWDCTWTSAPGVSFELSTADDLTIPFYTAENGTYSFTQTETTEIGGAAFANVPVTGAPARVIARLMETGEIIGCHEVVVRAGARTHLTLYPFDEPNFGCPGGLP
jgi:hypothetical protein